LLTLAQKLIYKVTLRQPSITQDSEGQPGDHTDYKMVWANVEDLSGVLLERSQLLSSEVNTRVTIRFNKTVRAGWEVRDDVGAIYRVDYICDPGIPQRGLFTELLCKKVDDGI
jgi:SPP1 family predicted phage head-tail adaptor